LVALVTSFLLIKSKAREIDSEAYSYDEDLWILSWYLFSLADLIALTWFIRSGADNIFGINARELIGRYKAVVFAVGLSPSVLAFILTLLPRRVFKLLYYPWIALWGVSALFFAWITIPWLLFVIITFVLFKTLILIVRLKIRFDLGSIFVVIGFVMVLFSFAVFLAQNL
jgi:hypothetical protein